MQQTSAGAAPEGTRLALIEAATHLFGKHGFAATSTREIAARADTNIASIAYHFGGKEGLRLACASEFARRIRHLLSQADLQVPASSADARQQLSTVVRTMATFVTTAPGAADMTGFVMRELAESGPAIDAIYADLIEPAHQLICALWGAATGRDPESEAVRLAVFSTIGQVVYFRLARPIVQRRMGWTDIGPAEAERIADLLVENLNSVLTGGDRS